MATEHNTYKLNVIIDGRDYVLTYDDKDERNAVSRWLNKYTDGEPGSRSISFTKKKRRDAKFFTLPAGITESVGRNQRGRRQVFTNKKNLVGKFSCKFKGLSKIVSYGDARNRAEALNEILKFRINALMTKKNEKKLSS